MTLGVTMSLAPTQHATEVTRLAPLDPDFQLENQ